MIVRLTATGIGCGLLALAGYLFALPLFSMYSWGWLTFVYLPANWVAASFPLTGGILPILAALEP